MNKWKSILAILVVMLCCDEMSACKPTPDSQTDVPLVDTMVVQPDSIHLAAVYSRVDSIVIETTSDALCCSYVLTQPSAWVIEDFYKDSVVLDEAAKQMLEEYVYHLFILKDSVLQTGVKKDRICDLPRYSVEGYMYGKKIVDKRVIPGEDTWEHSSYAQELSKFLFALPREKGMQEAYDKKFWGK